MSSPLSLHTSSLWHTHTHTHTHRDPWQYKYHTTHVYDKSRKKWRSSSRRNRSPQSPDQFDMSNSNSNTNEAQLSKFQRRRRHFLNDSNPEYNWQRICRETWTSVIERKKVYIYMLMTWERSSLAYFPSDFRETSIELFFVRLGHIVRTDAHTNDNIVTSSTFISPLTL